jgi:WD40 repeat protein
MVLSHFNFNQNASCFIVSHKNKFCIYQTKPLKLHKTCTMQSDIHICEMYKSSNIITLVLEDNKKQLIIWDCQKESIIDTKIFNKEILNIRIHEKYFAFVFHNSIEIFDFETLEQLKVKKTYDNPNASIAVSTSGECIMAYPSTEQGVVVIDYVDREEVIKIQAHENEISCLSIDDSGEKIATASTKGTLIRVFNLDNGRKLNEVRRGINPTLIDNISFNSDASNICVSSRRGTLHIFNLKYYNGTKNRTSYFSFVGGYFSSEWSFAWFDGETNCPMKCVFEETTNVLDHRINVLSGNGLLYKLSYDTVNGKECCMVKKHDLI